MKKLILVLILCLLPACETIKPQTPQQTVYAATSAFGVALSVAVAYRKLPTCSPAEPLLCSKPEIVEQLRQSANAANTTLAAAQNIVRTPGFGDDAAQSAIVAAQEAVKALTAITSTLKVTQ